MCECIVFSYFIVLQHYLLKSTRKSNVWGKIGKSFTVLDLGTGNGIWALEIASERPDCKVIGLDIRPPHEQQGRPRNLQYIDADITQYWPLETGSVDYIFQRSMGQVIQKQQWPLVLSEMMRVLKPGGTIELLEADLWYHNPGPVQKAFDEFCQSQWDEQGLDFTFADSIEDEIRAAGFAELEKRTLDIPIGEWPDEGELKQFGFINKEIQKAFLRNKKEFYVTKWGITPEDYDLAVQEVLTEFDEYHGFSRFNCWIAKKH
ncbi:S-adenosyl-L-methionine-dependent methyltransferase [Pilobolus umbonatus]|nr:S-adenosyl-L-methionine-dependent methyltransferase [Pilobolus umbonatus]